MQSQEQIKVFIVDDHEIFRNGLKMVINRFKNAKVIAEATSGKEFLELLDKNLPDIVLMDIEMPEMNGIEATEAVKNKYPQIKIIMLTVFDNDENIFNSIKAGADGYLLKEVNPEELHNAINETLNGGAAMTPSIALKTLKLLREPVVFDNSIPRDDVVLTTREIEVLEQLSKGLKYNAIAENLFLSAGTIRKHVENIYTKLQVHNKLEAIQKAKNNKLI